MNVRFTDPRFRLASSPSEAKASAAGTVAETGAGAIRAAARTVAQGGGPEPLTVVGDLRELKGCERLFNQVNDRFKRCDALINNAGATRAGNFLEQSDDLWLDGFALKFFGCVRLSRMFWPLLKAAQGNVVNIIGGAARTPGAQFMIGGAVNAAMGNFAKGLAQLGKQDGVNVNSIHPGMTETERTLQLHQQMAAASGRTAEAVQAEQVAKQGIRRLGKPDDIAALTLFLCSERARHIQGTAIAVDGGATPGYY